MLAPLIERFRHGDRLALARLVSLVARGEQVEEILAAIGPPAQSAVRDLLDRQTREPVTLLFAARDETRNNAVALKEWLDLRAG